MAEYIKREAMRKTLETWRDAHADVDDEDGWELLEDVLRELNAQATADVAPVIRCPECKYHHDCGTHFCDRLGMDCPDDSEFFCKYGARMDGAE